MQLLKYIKAMIDTGRLKNQRFNIYIISAPKFKNRTNGTRI